MSGLALDEVAPGTEAASPHRYGTGPKRTSRAAKELLRAVLRCAGYLVSGVATHPFA